MNAAEAVRYVAQHGDGLRPDMRWLLLCVALCADSAGLAVVSRSELARAYGSPERTTRDALDRLESTGSVKVERRQRAKTRVTLLGISGGGPAKIDGPSQAVYRPRPPAPWWPK